MLIVSDNSPLNLIVRLGEASILPALFSTIVIPEAVAAEMRHAKAPAEIQLFIAAPPTWLEIRQPKIQLAIPNLDVGEAAAISLAIELDATLMIDEQDGRAEAISRGLHVVGAIGVLERAANAGLIGDLKTVYDKIKSMRFHVSTAILDASLARHLSHRPKSQNNR